MNDRSTDLRAFMQRTALVVGLGLLAVLALLLLWNGFKYLLILFGGVLFAVFLNGLARFVEQHTPLGYLPAFAVVVAALTAVLGGLGWLIGAQIASQFSELVQRLPEAIDRLTSSLREYEWSRWILAQVPDPEDLVDSSGGETSGTETGASDASGSASTEGRVMGIFGATLTGLTYLLIALLIGFYAALHRSLYRKGLLHLVPPPRRARARKVMQALGHALRWWFIGRFASMVVVGLLTWLGLWLLGVPLAPVLGLLAALFSFIPYLGPLLSFVPAVLMGLLQSTQTGLYVIGLMALIQFLESYFITPLMEKKAVSLPPALLLTAEFLLGVIAGALGILLAAPLAVALVVLIQMLYVQDTLGDDSVHLLGT